ncbi:MAG: hydroxymethylglutaryl-CoA lyase [Lentisphaerales bacterium]|nr:hydroxymethylglutaryl-CoA lyase [Lentisphaerales bacterium]
MNKEIKIFEVGPRDGLQNEYKSLDLEVKLYFIKLLIEAGCKDIEAGAFVREDLVPQMADSDKLIPLAILNSPEYVRFHALVPNTYALQKAKECGVSNIGLLTSVCNTFCKRNLNTDFQTSIERVKKITKEAPEGTFKRLYISMAFHSSWSGRIDDEIFLEKSQYLSELDVDEFVLSDTNGQATPEDVIEKINSLKSLIPIEKIACHFHDTFDMALKNIEQAWKDGITTFDSSCGGLGGCPFTPGATGNVATDKVVQFFKDQNCETGIDLDKLKEASSFINASLQMANSH